MVRRIARSRAAALRASSPCRPAASIRRIARHSSWSSLLLREFVRSISIAAPAETFDNYAADNFFVSGWELHAKALLAYSPEFFRMIFSSTMIQPDSGSAPNSISVRIRSSRALGNLLARRRHRNRSVRDSAAMQAAGIRGRGSPSAGAGAAHGPVRPRSTAGARRGTCLDYGMARLVRVCRSPAGSRVVAVGADSACCLRLCARWASQP